MNENNIKVSGKNNRVNINITRDEECEDNETLERYSESDILTKYIDDHKITYLDQIFMEDVLDHSGVVIHHSIRREMRMMSLRTAMISRLELMGYPAGKKADGLRSKKIVKTGRICVYTNSPIVVFYRAMASANKALKSMGSDHIRTIDMSFLKKGFPEIYGSGMDVLNAKTKVAEQLKALMELELGVSFSKFDKFAKMSKRELIKYFEDKQPAK